MSGQKTFQRACASQFGMSESRCRMVRDSSTGSVPLIKLPVGSPSTSPRPLSRTATDLFSNSRNLTALHIRKKAPGRTGIP